MLVLIIVFQLDRQSSSDCEVSGDWVVMVSWKPCWGSVFLYHWYWEFLLLRHFRVPRLFAYVGILSRSPLLSAYSERIRLISTLLCLTHAFLSLGTDSTGARSFLTREWYEFPVEEVKAPKEVLLVGLRAGSPPVHLHLNLYKKSC